MNGKQLIQAIHRMYGSNKITENRLNHVLTMMNPVSYACHNHTVKGHPLTFDVPNYDEAQAQNHRPWQKGILKATCNPNIPDVTIMKARQLGLSEVGVMTLLYLMDLLSSDRLKFMYLFPTYNQVQDFLKSRIRPELSQGYYHSLLDQNNNSLQQFTFRNSTAFFRTGNKASAVEGVDIDVLMLDEYERYAGSAAESSAIESLQSSKYGLIRRWSTPSVPDYGTDAKYKQSDQRHWLIKCEHCGYLQEITFDKNLRVVDPSLIDHVSQVAHPGSCEYVCQHCGRNLDSSRWYNGQWVAKKPGQGKPVGFFVSQLNAVWLPPEHIYTRYLQSRTKQFFYNYTLGIPYQNQAMKLHPQDVLSHRRPYLPRPVEDVTGSRYVHVTFGIDWGEHWHHIVVVGMTDNGNWDIIKLVKIPRSTGTDNIEADLNRVIEVIEQYHPDIVAADLGYSGDYDQKLLHMFPNVVYGVNVRSAKSNGDPIAHFNDNTHIITLDKLTQNKIALREIKSGRIGFYQHVDQNLKIFIRHWQCVIIRDQPNENTGQVDQIITRNGGDHFAQASVYGFAAMNEVCNRLAQRAGNLQVSSLDVADDRPIKKGSKYFNDTRGM